METRDGRVRKRRRSYNTPGHAHELTFSCHHRMRLLTADRTRRWFVDAITRARDEHSFDLWAYVIMPDHAHVLLFPREERYDIAAILKSIKQPVARRAVAWLEIRAPDSLARLRVERPGGRVERRFWQQGGGYDRNLFEPLAIHQSIDYIHMNPVRARLVRHATDWEWSSARWHARDRTGPLAIDDHSVPRLGMA